MLSLHFLPLTSMAFTTEKMAELIELALEGGDYIADDIQKRVEDGLSPEKALFATVRDPNASETSDIMDVQFRMLQQREDRLDVLRLLSREKLDLLLIQLAPFDEYETLHDEVENMLDT